MEKVLLIGWKLLNEWYCISKDATEEEVLSIIKENLGGIATTHQIKQRLFGGFPCGDFEDRYHVFHDTGAYTYTGTNSDVQPGYREEKWKILLEANKEPMIEGVLFMEDYLVEAV